MHKYLVCNLLFKLIIEIHYWNLLLKLILKFLSGWKPNPQEMKERTCVENICPRQRADIYIYALLVWVTHPWPFSKSKFNLKFDRVNLVAPASSFQCLLYLPDVRAIPYRRGWPGSEIQMYYGCFCLYPSCSNFLWDLTWPKGRCIDDWIFKNLPLQNKMKSADFFCFCFTMCTIEIEDGRLAPCKPSKFKSCLILTSTRRPVYFLPYRPV